MGTVSFLLLPHLDRARDEGLVVDAASFARGSSADERFIDFNMGSRQTTDRVLIGSHHRRSQLV
jgi:hypothetical protein